MLFQGDSLLMSLLVSSVGFALFVYGKRQSRPPQLAGGVVLMVFPYFVANPLLMLGIAALVVALLFGAVKLGW